MTAQPKTILITHVYSSDNKGDAALTSVLIQDLKRKFPSATLTILKLESVEPGGRFEGVPEKPSFMYYVANRYRHPLLKLAYALAMMAATLAWAAWYRLTGWHGYLPPHLRHIARLYEQADLIVPVGGGYIRSRQGLVMRFNVPLLLHPLLFGYLLRKPTVLYSQSIGPFHGRLDERLVAFVLRRMTLILLREDTSAALLKDLGVTRNVKRAIDSGFLLTSSHKADIRNQYHIPADRLLVGVTVRSWLKGEAQRTYEAAVAAALDDLLETSAAHVIFIPQVTANKGDDDRVVSHRVRDLMHHPAATTVVDGTPDHHRIKALYDNLDILLGTRFHSVIFSLTSYVPVLAIEYEHKTSGIMHDLKLDRWVIKIEDVTSAKLIEQLHRLVREQPHYRAHLRKYLPQYILRAEKTVDMLADSYFAAAQYRAK
ncbi:MAG TPA: polysaccharide pyruvyl transferase family protein [Candidatus Saccharimonadia bacterium]|nr:polysaccharide pyruvyl transferase family protein [Candidatus Saccharimonadia bacterium]